jgi:hypothetical protein
MQMKMRHFLCPTQCAGFNANPARTTDLCTPRAEPDGLNSHSQQTTRRAAPRVSEWRGDEVPE